MASKPPPVASIVGPAVTAAATALGIAAPSLSGSAGKTFEAWILFEVALGLKAKGRGVMGMDAGGQQPLSGPYIVRGGPGHLPAASASVPSVHPSFFVLQGSQEPVELHNGVEHKGLSGEEHELDISVIQRGFADVVRSQGGGPSVGSVLAAAELKAYDRAASIPKAFARTLLGILVDVDPLGLFRIAVGKTRLHFNGVGSHVHALLTTAAMTAQTQNYLAFYEIDAAPDLVPSNRATLDRYIDRIDAAL